MSQPKSAWTPGFATTLDLIVILNVAGATLNAMLWLPAVAARAPGPVIDGEGTVAIITHPVVPIIKQLITLVFFFVGHELDNDIDAGALPALDDFGVAVIAAVPGAGLAEVEGVCLTVGVGPRGVALAVVTHLACRARADKQQPSSGWESGISYLAVPYCHDGRHQSQVP
jgi:hypothetical protein